MFFALYFIFAQEPIKFLTVCSALCLLYEYVEKQCI